MWKRLYDVCVGALLVVVLLLGSSAAPERADIISVRSHGAKCDGVADDSKAVEAATNAVGRGGGIVFVPPGTRWDHGGITMNRLAVVLDLSKPWFPRIWSGEAGFTPMIMGRSENGNAGYLVLHNLESDPAKACSPGIVAQMGDPDDPINLWQLCFGNFLDGRERRDFVVYGWQDPAHGTPTSPGHQRARLIWGQNGAFILNSTSAYQEGYDPLACVTRDAMLVVNPSQPDGSTARILLKSPRKGGAAGIDLEPGGRRWRFQVDEVSNTVQFIQNGRVVLTLDGDGNLTGAGKIKGKK